MLALVGDSTNSDIPKDFQALKMMLRKHLSVKLFSQIFNKRIVITCFSSNIARIQSIAFMQQRKMIGKVSIIGRSMRIEHIEIAFRNGGYLENIDEISLTEDEIQYYIPRENIVIICTGSQGEKKISIVSGLHIIHIKHIKLENEDVVIFSSKDIPGNEKLINNLKNLLIKTKS